MSETKQLTVYEAARAGDVERISTYVSKGGNIHEPEPRSGMTILHFACFGDGGEKNRAIVGLLLAQEGVKLEETDLGDEWTPLHAAAKAGNAAAVEELLNVGVNANARDKMGRTPLHLAALSSNDDAVPEVIKLLLGGGSNKKIKSIMGLTAGEAARMNGVSDEICVMLGAAEKSAEKADDNDDKKEEEVVGAAAAAAAASAEEQKNKSAPPVANPVNQEELMKKIVEASKNNNPPAPSPPPPSKEEEKK